MLKHINFAVFYSFFQCCIMQFYIFLMYFLMRFKVVRPNRFPQVHMCKNFYILMQPETIYIWSIFISILFFHIYNIYTTMLRCWHLFIYNTQVLVHWLSIDSRAWIDAINRTANGPIYNLKFVHVLYEMQLY